MKSIRDEFLLIDQRHKLHVRTSLKENADKVFFFVHGAGGYVDQWQAQIQCFAKDHSVVAYDWLGHGMSDKPDSRKGEFQYSFDKLVQCLITVFERYQGKENIIVGHSYGGPQAVYLTLKYAKDISRLVLLAPAPCQSFEVLPWVWSLPLALLDRLRGVFAERLSRMAFDHRAPRALVEDEVRAAMNNPMHVMRSLVAGMHDIPRLDMTLLKQPCLLLAGISDRVITLPEIEESYLRIPQLQFEILPQCGHMVMLEKPREVNEKIFKFIQ